MSAERNWSSAKAFEALTPRPVASFWNTGCSGIRVDIELPKQGHSSSGMRQAFISMEDNVDVYDAAQLAVFFAKLAVHLGNDDTRVKAFASGGRPE